ncbi:MAG: alpha/beta hydrolase [Acidimicrobiales bacterium]|nr:alpha/beta hydrolase [Acidimicrobiales bacterium]
MRSSQGVEVAVHDFGGDGPLLVMAHATGFHGMVYQPLAHKLNSHFHCVAFDFRGHGKSVLPPAASLDWHRMTDDLLAVIDGLSAEKPVRVFGHSMGGACIALAAQREPDRILSAWTYEPILLPALANPQPSQIAEGARRRRPVFPSRSDARANYQAKPPLDLLSSDALDWYVEHGFVELPDGTVQLACLPETEAMVFEGAHSGALEAALSTSVPFAVAVGSDGGMPAQAGRAAALRAPNLTLVPMDLSHFGPLEAPETVASAVIRWFL